MRSLSLTLLAVAALLAPSAALAATPVAPAAATTRSFEIRALALGDMKLEVSGKLGIEGTQLMASAGCNAIGGTVSVDGDTVTIVGPMFMTEMACPGSDGDAEAMLIKILNLGIFKITDAAWIADGGQILTVEIPGSVPGPAGSPPDEPITSGPIATIVDPAPSGLPAGTCPPIPADNGSTTVGSGSSGGGTVNPGIVVVPPDATSGSEPGATPGSEPAATAIDLPLETGTVDPEPPVPNPGVTFSLGQTEPDPSFAVIQPDPIGKDPNVGKALVDPCYGASLGAGQVEADLTAPKAMANDDNLARDAAASPGLVLSMALALGVLVLAGMGIDRRRRTVS